MIETSMNVMTEPLHRDDKAVPRGLHVCPSYGTYNCGSQKKLSSCITPRITPSLSRKGLLWPGWWQLMRFLRWWSQMVQLELFKLEEWPKRAKLSLVLGREERSCSKGWSSQASSPGQRRTREELWTYWLNTMTSLHWKMEKWDALELPNTRSK